MSTRKIRLKNTDTKVVLMRTRQTRSTVGGQQSAKDGRRDGDRRDFSGQWAVCSGQWASKVSGRRSAVGKGRMRDGDRRDFSRQWTVCSGQMAEIRRQK